MKNQQQKFANGPKQLICSPAPETSAFNADFITSFNVNICGFCFILYNDNYDLFEDILIYPNPVRDIVTIELKDNFTDGTAIFDLHLYNMVGVEVSISKKQFVSLNKLEIDIF